MASYHSSKFPMISGPPSGTSAPPLLSRNRLQDALNTIIACLAVLGNGMVITVMILRRRVFNSFVNRLILHQSFIDAIAGVVFFFHIVVWKLPVVVSMEGNVYDHLACRIGHTGVLLWCVSVTSTYNLVMISLERFMATCYPVKHRKNWSVTRLKSVVLAVWGIGFVYGSHLLFVYEPRQGLCKAVEMDLGMQVLVAMVVVFTEFLLPISIMIYSYTGMLLKLTKKLRNSANTRQSSLSKAKKNVFTTTLLANIMFVVCWTPTEIDYLDELFFHDVLGNQVYLAVTGLLACNMFVNPIIYCFKYQHFRSQLTDLVLKRLRRNRVHIGQARRHI